MGVFGTRLSRREFVRSAVAAAAAPHLAGVVALAGEPRGREAMDAKTPLDGAEPRIREHRTALAKLKLLDRAGRPVAGAEVEVRLVRHEFKLGANAFRLGAIKDAKLQSLYEERFAGLLNYATLPFYWGSYEPERGKTSERRLESMARWCRDHGVTPKGHPLVWHEVYPSWAKGLSDAEVLGLQEKRVREIVARFAGLIDIWDVVNEATVSHRFENALGRWIAREGAARCVGQALSWARESGPKATLLYNDFNVSPEFEALVRGLLEARSPLDAIGIQSHMHKGTWPLARAWEVCETYSRFGLPLHFTELTILSGRLKAQDDNDWHRVQPDWASTAEGEAAQLEYGSGLYTLLFSHPAVEAITCWDFSDDGAWQGAPAGLVRRDMSPKPLYDWLVDAFHRRWVTREKTRSDASGVVNVRCFFGEHELRARTASGEELGASFRLSRRGTRELTVEVA